MKKAALALTVCAFSCFAAAPLEADAKIDAPKQPTLNKTKWIETPLPFRPFNITAIGDSMWLCGLDETIAVSTDGGNTWQSQHQKQNGEVLLKIAFVDATVGHAAGTGGLILSTNDGGKSWSPHTTVGPIKDFSFADSLNGIANIHGIVKMTTDGGDHWQDVQFLQTDEKLKTYSGIQSLAALSPTHYAVALHQQVSGGQDILASTTDGGKTWTATHLENTIAGSLFVRDGQYWDFGIEYLGREHNPGGGYSVPVTLHSTDGEHWQRGLREVNESRGCTIQGCFQPYGVIEVVYGGAEKIWSLPQNLPTAPKWAIASGRVCTIDHSLRCGSAIASDAPQPPPDNAPSNMFEVEYSKPFFEGCLDCQMTMVAPDKAWAGRAGRLSGVVAEVKVNRNGSVGGVAIQGIPSKSVTDAIALQIRQWVIAPAHEAGQTAAAKLKVNIELLCFPDFPGHPGSGNCSVRTVGMDAQPSLEVNVGH